MNLSPLTEAAVEYLSLGLSVIALTGKTPNVTKHRTGLHSALYGAPETAEDYQFIAGFMDHEDTTGLAIVIPYPYVVVDIDGEEGAEQFQELVYEDNFGEPQWVAKTGRGLHFWFSSIQPTGTIKLGEKLDLKGQGGYVAVPPSLHPDGHVYKWLSPPSAEAPPKEVPDAIARRIAQHAFDLEGRLLTKGQRRTVRQPRYKSGDTVFYAQRGNQSLLDGMRNALEGNRNNYLHWAAATMAEEGGIDEDFDELRAIALEQGLDPVEVKRTIRSARRLSE